MAPARRIKTLLTVNILFFLGIVLFSVYCRISERPEELVQISDTRLRSRTGSQQLLKDRDNILQRLDHLEDVVYNQLNGLAKPIGLMEGPGGLGQGGVAATMRDESREFDAKYEDYGYNAQLSDRISLDRSIPDYRPQKVQPVLSRIKEDRTRIILPAIDNIKYNTFEVQQYANAAHGYNWGLWCMYIIPPQDWLDKGDETAPIRTPAMIGCSFVVHREYFGEIGLLDPGMEIYGGENIELGMRVWQCGGSMEVLPCSRVAHIERTKKPYNNDIDYYAKRNALRAAEVWMDDFKSHVYMAWNIPINNPGVDFGDVSDRVALRKRLNCRSFRWYRDNVYPEMRIYNNTITYGEVRNSKASGYCLDQGSEEDDRAILYPCHGMTSQLVRYTTEGLLQLGPLGSTNFLPDTKCLIDDRRIKSPSLRKCDEVPRANQKLWDFTQNGPIINRDTGRCLEVEMTKDANFGLRLSLQKCSGQKWIIRNWIKHVKH
ncbi:polypeptide N-acetylgalactosaminyltransferase 9 [Rhincodon typus]|uniref:polypeptide N-acetylgalactosaminyltransferase 9 n=1 Tax=Rhincodon typus TaxID=259920 RepID=UPI002030491A|nr:polypeptide N-acetylgalactosaminyltransferase 9 [Rhincodon typus]